MSINQFPPIKNLCDTHHLYFNLTLTAEVYALVMSDHTVPIFLNGANFDSYASFHRQPVLVHVVILREMSCTRRIQGFVTEDKSFLQLLVHLWQL